MSKHVIIYMPLVGEDNVQWAISDEKGTLTTAVREGTLREVADNVEGRKATLILPADDVLLAQTVVPGNSLARAQQAVPFALEEQVADDVDDLHFALGTKNRNDEYPVAVIGLDVMDMITERCAEAGLRPTEIVPETLALPLLSAATPGLTVWSALLDQGRAVVRLAEYQGFATDAGMASLMIEGALTSVEEQSQTSLVAFSTNTAAPLDVPATLDMEIRHCDHPLALYASGLASTSHVNLLQGIYNPKKNFDKTWKPWRATGILAASICLVLFAGKWMELRQLQEQEAVLDTQIASAFKQAMPGTRMQRPRRQVQSALEGMGAVNNDGFTSRMAQIAASLSTQPQTQLRTIGYRNGRFDLDLNTDDVPTLDALKSELGKRGSLDMSVQSANRENNTVRGRVRIE
ncbi:MAG: type II secretion system protein GspL [Granulosicoccus sp.]